jgi:hypothetical protein
LVDNCTNLADGVNGRCSQHPSCSVHGCHNLARLHGKCNEHNRPPLCAIANCQLPAVLNGKCLAHNLPWSLRPRQVVDYTSHNRG